MFFRRKPNRAVRNSSGLFLSWFSSLASETWTANNNISLLLLLLKNNFKSMRTFPKNRFYMTQKPVFVDLAGVAQLVGHHPADQEVMGSVPSQGTSLGCRFGPHPINISLSHPCFSSPLSPSLPLCLQSIKETMYIVLGNNITVVLWNHYFN